MSRRVVITGMGTINPLAHDVAATWQKLLAGESGISIIENVDLEGIRCHIGGQIKNFDSSKYHIDSKMLNKMDVFQQYAFAAMFEAAKQAKMPVNHPEDHSIVYPEFEGIKPIVDDPYRMGLILGIGLGGINTTEKQVEIMLNRGARRVTPFLIPKMIGNLAGGWISQSIQARGVTSCNVTACAAGTNALGEAFLAIKYGRADVMVSGGFESGFTRLGLAGFANMKALSLRNDEPEKASRPFDRDRTGFVMGEGGAIIILEEYEHAKKRGANILAEFVGYGLTEDAYHMTSPNPQGEGAIKAIEIALDTAGIGTGDVDYINAHGTSTQANDQMENRAVKAAFKDDAYRLCMSSTKSMTGHLLGGAGAFECMVAVKAVQEDKVPPTINLDNPDEEMDLDYVANTMQEREVRYAMSNSFGFGGHNAVIIVKKYSE